MNHKGVQGGTPVGNDSMCSTCRMAMIVKGQAASQQIVHCNMMDRDIHFPVVSCISYQDRRGPTMDSMEQLAWIIRTKHINRPAGFANALTDPKELIVTVSEPKPRIYRNYPDDDQVATPDQE